MIGTGRHTPDRQAARTYSDKLRAPLSAAVLHRLLTYQCNDLRNAVKAESMNLFDKADFIQSHNNIERLWAKDTCTELGPYGDAPTARYKILDTADDIHGNHYVCLEFLDTFKVGEPSDKPVQHFCSWTTMGRPLLKAKPKPVKPHYVGEEKL
jgi:hypothetical protein